MVAIEEVVDDGDKVAADATPTGSRERLRDAEEIETLLDGLKRPTARMRIESLVKKIRREAAALRTVEAVESEEAASAAAAAATTTPPAAKAPPAAPAPSPPPKPLPSGVGVASSSAAAAAPSVSSHYTSIDRFAFDAGSGGDKFVTLYLPLPGVGALRSTPEAVTSGFTASGFDVAIVGLDGKNYRLKRDNLEHPIVPESSRHVIKKDKIVVKLCKTKAEYGGYDHWSKLTDPNKTGKGGAKGGKSSSDPSAGLMDMMKNLYDSGDDKMRKMIGETMLKQRTGELDRDQGDPFGNAPPGL